MITYAVRTTTLVAFASLALCGAAAAQNHTSTDAVDKEYLHTSAQGNLAEVQLAKLALHKSHNHDVRAFAQKMIHDHTKIMQNMRPLAAKAGLQPVTTISAEDQLEMRKLRSLSGNEFNRQYVSYMVEDHQKDLASCKQEAESTADPFLKKTVEESGQIIQQHAELIDQLAKNNHINVPGQ